VRLLEFDLIGFAIGIAGHDDPARTSRQTHALHVNGVLQNDLCEFREDGWRSISFTWAEL
jgi:hypothetical protein